MKLTTDTKQYAKLLLSVGKQGRNLTQKRPLTPIECAELINRLKEEEGETLAQISERLDLGRPEEKTSIYKKRDGTQARLFLKLLKLSEKSRYFAGWGWEGYPKIPFSIMALMDSLTPDEQDKIIQSSYNDEKKKIINSDDIRKINSWKNENKDLPIETCIEKVLKLKPVVVTTHMIVCEISDKLKIFIQSNSDYREKLLQILRDGMKGQFHSIDATNILITISMDKEAYKTFHDQQYKQKVSFTQFLNEFLENKIG